MQYDFTDKSPVINDLEMEENIHSYPIYQQQQQYNILKSTLSNSNMMTTSDIWQSSPSNSNTNYQSLYFPSSFDFNNSKQYHTTDNNHFDYQSSSYLIDPYSHTFPNNYSTNSYSTQTVYNSTSMESSTYFTPIDSYQNFHSVYTDPNRTLPSSSSSSQWDLGTIKMPNHDVISTSNSNIQPCLVCHEACDIPLSNITKSNRKDCRACRKAKCDEVGMTILPKDRISRIKTTSKSSLISINNLLEQLAHDLTYNQLSTSSTLENLLHLLDLPSIIPINFDYHSLYMNAVQIWRNQYNHLSQIFINISFNDTFAVLLFLFYSFMFMKDNKSTNNIKFDKLINILQEEINRITGIDHRLTCRIKALFMKCYVALAQYYPNNTNLFHSNYNSQSQSILSYQ